MVAAVIVRGGLILAAKRGPQMSLSGFWEFPGGKIENGESPKAALLRELKEELLCDAEIGTHIDTTAYEYDFAIVNLATYYAKIISGDPVLTEHEEVRWLAPGKLLEIEWAPADIPAVRKIMSDFGVCSSDSDYARKIESL